MKKLPPNDPEMQSTDGMSGEPDYPQRGGNLGPGHPGLWRMELAPAVSTTFVFRDSAFDDVGKTNLAAILEQNLPASALAGIRSL